MTNENSLIGIPDFRKLYTARFISTVGAKFFALAISWWVLDSGFENASSLLGIIMAATALGTFGCAPFMGTFADKYSKKKTMLVALIGEAVVVGIVILIFPVFNHLPLLFAVFAVLIYAFEPLFETSLQSSLNVVVKPSLVPNAVSAISGITSFSQALGAACAGVAITALGVLGAFSLDCACYLISAWLIARLVTKIPVKSNEATNEANAPKASYWKDLAEGFLYVYKDKALLWLLVFFAVVNLFVSPIVLALPIIAKTVFDGTALLMSGYEVSLAIGIVAITTVLGRVSRKFNRYTGGFWAILLCGISLVGLSFCRHEYLTFGFVFLFGVGLGLVNVSMMTIFQMYVPVYIQGRFFSIVNTIAGAVIPLSYAFVGFLSDQIGVMPLMAVNGCVLAVSSVVMLLIPKIKGEYIL